MKMITPPECQGQIVEWSYGDARDGTVYRRCVDRSDRSVQWWRAAYAELFPGCECFDDGCAHWSPPNREPGGRQDAWVRCDEPRGDGDQ